MKRKKICTTIILLSFCALEFANGQISPLTHFIGVDVSTQPQNTGFDYNSCFALGTGLGMSRVGLFQNWTAIETAPLTYNLNVFDIANSYYPAANMAIDLTITPIHTNNLEVPSDLTAMALDSSTLINRFKVLLDSIKLHIPNLTLSSLVVGSEHDVYMGSNATRWTQYTNFYNSVTAYAKSLWPGLKVATELTFGGITAQNTFAQALNTNSDYIGVSYYPLNTDFTVKPVTTIPADFATLVALYPSKPICFYQYGYPSGATCNSSESKQSDFITQTFTSWDTYAANIRMIDFTWLHDLSTATVNYYATYYGISNPAFLEYLHTLGLRAWDNNGTNKFAFTELQCQAKKRGYNNLNINCFAGVADVNGNDSPFITLINNAVENKLIVKTSLSLAQTGISIYNRLGQMQNIKLIFSGDSIIIETGEWPNGMYFLRMENANIFIDKKFLLIR